MTRIQESDIWRQQRPSPSSSTTAAASPSSRTSVNNISNNKIPRKQYTSPQSTASPSPSSSTLKQSPSHGLPKLDRSKLCLELEKPMMTSFPARHLPPPPPLSTSALTSAAVHQSSSSSSNQSRTKPASNTANKGPLPPKNNKGPIIQGIPFRGMNSGMARGSSEVRSLKKSNSLYTSTSSSGSRSARTGGSDGTSVISNDYDSCGAFDTASLNISLNGEVSSGLRGRSKDKKRRLSGLFNNFSLRRKMSTASLPGAGMRGSSSSIASLAAGVEARQKLNNRKQINGGQFVPRVLSPLPCLEEYWSAKQPDNKA